MSDKPQTQQVGYVNFRKIHLDARLPFYASEMAVCADLFAIVDNRQGKVIITN